MHNKLYESVEVLQLDFYGWPAEYNLARPHQGYRNLGKRPIGRIDEFIKERSVREEDVVAVVVEKSLTNAQNDT